MNISINGKSMTITGDCKNVSIQNGKITVNGNVVEGTKDVIDVHVDGNVGSIKCNGSVDVTGSVSDGVDCSGSLSCEDVNGKIDCGGSVNCGIVGGDIDAGGSVRCGQVGGNVDAGGSIKMIK
jgi:hypothetical protein